MKTASVPTHLQFHLEEEEEKKTLKNIRLDDCEFYFISVDA